jgi:hypothetical protein
LRLHLLLFIRGFGVRNTKGRIVGYQRGYLRGGEQPGKGLNYFEAMEFTAAVSLEILLEALRLWRTPLETARSRSETVFARKSLASFSFSSLMLSLTFFTTVLIEDLTEEFLSLLFSL